MFYLFIYFSLNPLKLTSCNSQQCREWQVYQVTPNVRYFIPSVYNIQRPASQTCIIFCNTTLYWEVQLTICPMHSHVTARYYSQSTHPHTHVSTGKLPGNNFYDILQNRYVLYTVRLDKIIVDGDIRQCQTVMKIKI